MPSSSIIKKMMRKGTFTIKGKCKIFCNNPQLHKFYREERRVNSRFENKKQKSKFVKSITKQ